MDKYVAFAAHGKVLSEGPINGRTIEQLVRLEYKKHGLKLIALSAGLLSMWIAPWSKKKDFKGGI
jgi:predicted metalloenzyme YecM